MSPCTRNSSLGCLLQVRIFQDNLRRLAAEFQQNGFQVLTAEFSDNRADGSGASKIDFPNSRVRYKCLNYSGSVFTTVLNDVKDTGREASVTEYSANEIMSARTEFRGFETGSMLANRNFQRYTRQCFHRRLERQPLADQVTAPHSKELSQQPLHMAPSPQVPLNLSLTNKLKWK